jgi:hypothetical protein
MTIQAIPVTYRGIKFRSALEADWASTFDWYDIYWEYENLGIELKDGTRYLPDFYLPESHIWCEAKGPHNERLVKAQDLNAEIWSDDWLEREPFVVVLRAAGPGNRATWESCNPSMKISLYQCPYCLKYSFADYNGLWRCRLVNCRQPLERWHLGRYFSGDGHFQRAPRP